MIALPAVVVVALVLALTGGSGSDEQPTTTASAKRADRFDSARAWRHLEYQVALGPRPAGSAPSRKLAAYLRKRLPRGHYENIAAHPGLRNVVGRIPGSKPAIV